MDRLCRVRPRLAVGALGGAGLLLSFGSLAFAPLRFPVETPAVRASLETGAGIVTLAAIFVLLGRYDRRRSLSSLMLPVALCVFGVSSLLVMQQAFTDDPGPQLVWAPIVGLLIVPLLLIACALAPEGPMRHAPPPSAVAVGGLVLALLAGVAGMVIGDIWPGSIEPAPRRGGALVDAAQASDTLVTMQVLGLAAYAAACAVLLGWHGRDGEPLLGWLAIAAALLALERLNMLLHQPPADAFSAAEVLRLAAIACVLAAIACELGRRRQDSAAAAVAGERQRMARELHDGLAQELAIIVSQSSRANDGSSPVMREIAEAADRALFESRRALHALKRPDSPGLAAAIAEHALEIAERAGLELNLEILDDVQAGREVEHAILRIVREAISNAARHSGCSKVTVRLASQDGKVLVRISDNGHGFEVPPVAGRRSRGRFGLVGMAERVEAFGGELRLESEPGRGTVVEVMFR